MFRRTICFLIIVSLLFTYAWAEPAQATSEGLTVGSVDTGADSKVIAVQEKLISLGLLSGTADGHFGEKTATAVELFQQMYGLSATGVADPETQGVLSSAEIGVLQIQEKLISAGILAGEADGKLGEGTASAIRVFQQMYDLPVTGVADPETRSLLFTTSNLIYSIQNKLIELDYLEGVADGVLGSATTNAISSFQSVHGLSETGVANTETRNLLLGGTSLTTKPTPTPSPRAMGASGTDISISQEKLAQWGFLEGSVDGDYGKSTEKAVKAFKTYQYAAMQAYLEANPTPTPVVTPSPTPAPTPTLTPGEQPIVIDATLEPVPTPTPSPTPYAPSGEIEDALLNYFLNGSFEVYKQPLSEGDSGEEVLRLQRRLTQLHYLYNGADGAFGSLTANALKYFQYLNDLDQTGIADENTQRKLFSPAAVESTEYVFPYKLIIDVSDQRVYVYQWTGTSYGEHIGTMKCSTGTKSDPTPLGTYQAAGPAGGRWYYFKDFDCYAQYATRIIGGILFHSVIYGRADESTLQRSSVRNLGRRASHGCIRLSVDNAKWIYQNCPVGTTVVIRD